MADFVINTEGVGLKDIRVILDKNHALRLGKEARKKIADCRIFLESAIARSEKPIYGVNTGFGALCDTVISKEAISDLQVNLVLSHACGMGDRLDEGLSRLMLLLKIINLSRGHSGIRLETIDRMIYMYNAACYPVIPEQGSLGASGDLAPLAHLSLPLIGRGEVWLDGKIKPASDWLKDKGLSPLELKAKEGLALINGTQFMTASLVKCLLQIEDLLLQSDIITVMSLDAFACLEDPFNANIHAVRPHPGQIETARSIWELRKGSKIAAEPGNQVQDPYSFRCVPQVHGASRDAINYAKEVAEREIVGVSDNPLLFPEDNLVLSAGNFHGQPLALTLDFLAIALAELASISERRTYKLLAGQRGLPVFLIANAGLHSGFMIPQYSAASMVSQNKQLCTPSSVDTIDSSNGQEDHVSMGANGALKCLKVLKNYIQVLGIELFTSAQALDFRRPLESSSIVEKYHHEFRKEVPFLKEDSEMHIHMHKACQFIGKQTLFGL